jgi:hypothetical protein
MTTENTTPAATSTKINLDNIDGILFVDFSGSMAGEVGVGSNPKMTRCAAGKESIEAFAEELAKHDDDGITVVPFASSFEVIDGVTPDTVGKVYEDNKPDGSTYLAKPLQAVIDKFLPAQKKTAPAPVAAPAPAPVKTGLFGRLFGSGPAAPATRPTARAVDLGYERISPKKAVFIGILTDGAASDKDAVIRVIADATKRITSRRDFGILFIQVGNDPDAAAFLDEVNNGLEGGVADFDVVACTKLEDLEDMSCEQIITLAYTG